MIATVAYRYVSEEVEDVVEHFNVTSTGDADIFKVTPDDYGKYRVVARDVESGASSSIWFYASGWGYAPWAMDHPDRIELDLDKDSYLPGEIAQVQIRAPFAGKLLLTIEREKVFEYKSRHDERKHGHCQHAGERSVQTQRLSSRRI